MELVKNMYNSKKNKRGFALLFTVLVISVMLGIASGVSLNLVKNLILSSTARESQVAFYQADTAGECGLFASRYIDLDNLISNNTTFSCGDLSLEVSSPSSNKYVLSDSNVTTSPCFSIEIDKTSIPIVIKARGYNTCENANTVERGIEISY